LETGENQQKPGIYFDILLMKLAKHVIGLVDDTAVTITSVTHIFRSFSLLNFALVNRLRAREWGEGYAFRGIILSRNIFSLIPLIIFP
jgi:hypothetical protein